MVLKIEVDHTTIKVETDADETICEVIELLADTCVDMLHAACEQLSKDNQYSAGLYDLLENVLVALITTDDPPIRKVADVLLARITGR